MKLILATLLALACSSTHAQTIPLSINGAAKCAAARTGDAFTGVVDRACQNVPPPVDPGAYTTLAVTWLNHGDRTAHIIDVTRCENLLGRIGYSYPIVGWPYAGGATVQWSKTSPKYLRCRVHMPINPGVAARPITIVGSYGSTVPVRMAVVAPGASWPTGLANGCWIPSGQSERFKIYIFPGPTPNPSWCSAPIGGDVDLLVDSATGALGKVAISAN